MKIGTDVYFAGIKWTVECFDSGLATLLARMPEGSEVLRLVKEWGDNVNFRPSLSGWDLIAENVHENDIRLSFDLVSDLGSNNDEEVAEFLTELNFKETVAKVISHLRRLTNHEREQISNILALRAFPERKIDCIKGLRTLSGLSLPESKRLMEELAKI